MTELPSGTVTLLFTDIVGSSSLWDAHRDDMGIALRAHNALVRQAIEAHRGAIVKDKGDGFFAVFVRASDAVSAALQAQRAMRDEGWPESIGQISVRMALHSGPAEERDGDYHGPIVNRVARLEGLAHGGQTLVSESTRALTQDDLPDEASLTDLGFHRLRASTAPSVSINSTPRTCVRLSRPCGALPPTVCRCHIFQRPSSAEPPR